MDGILPISTQIVTTKVPLSLLSSAKLERFVVAIHQQHGINLFVIILQMQQHLYSQLITN